MRKTPRLIGALFELALLLSILTTDIDATIIIRKATGGDAALILELNGTLVTPGYGVGLADFTVTGNCSLFNFEWCDNDCQGIVDEAEAAAVANTIVLFSGRNNACDLCGIGRQAAWLKSKNATGMIHSSTGTPGGQARWSWYFDSEYISDFPLALATEDGIDKLWALKESSDSFVIQFDLDENIWKTLFNIFAFQIYIQIALSVAVFCYTVYVLKLQLDKKPFTVAMREHIKTIPVLICIVETLAAIISIYFAVKESTWDNHTFISLPIEVVALLGYILMPNVSLLLLASMWKTSLHKNKKDKFLSESNMKLVSLTGAVVILFVVLCGILLLVVKTTSFTILGALASIPVLLLLFLSITYKHYGTKVLKHLTRFSATNVSQNVRTQLTKASIDIREISNATMVLVALLLMRATTAVYVWPYYLVRLVIDPVYVFIIYRKASVFHVKPPKSMKISPDKDRARTINGLNSNNDTKVLSSTAMTKHVGPNGPAWSAVSDAQTVISGANTDDDDSDED